MLNDPLAQVLAAFAGRSRAAPLKVKSGLQVTGNSHGVAKGWFNWPFNFDPTWLESCDGFEAGSLTLAAHDR
jgi:hypothetical protein